MHDARRVKKTSNRRVKDHGSPAHQRAWWGSLANFVNPRDLSSRELTFRAELRANEMALDASTDEVSLDAEDHVVIVAYHLPLRVERLQDRYQACRSEAPQFEG